MLIQVHHYTATCDRRSSDECYGATTLTAPSDLVAMAKVSEAHWRVESEVLSCPACTLELQE